MAVVRLNRLFLSLFLGLIISGVPGAEEIHLVTADWEPYAGEHLPDYGFTSEIITEAFRRRGYTVVFHFVPWKRAELYVQEGRYDALYSAYYSEERAQVYAVSSPYIESYLMLCSLKGAGITYSSLRDLISYRIGTVRGYVNTPEFDRADFLSKEEVVSDLLNIRKLLARRLDLIVIDKYLMKYQMAVSTEISSSLSDTEFLEPPLDVKPVFVMFSRKVEGYEQKRNDFNEGLKAIREDGTYQKILSRYGYLFE